MHANGNTSHNHWFRQSLEFVVRVDKWWNNEATADGLHYRLKILIYIWTDGPSWGSPEHCHKYNKPVASLGTACQISECICFWPLILQSPFFVDNYVNSIISPSITQTILQVKRTSSSSLSITSATSTDKAVAQGLILLHLFLHLFFHWRYGHEGPCILYMIKCTWLEIFHDLMYMLLTGCFITLSSYCYYYR